MHQLMIRRAAATTATRAAVTSCTASGTASKQCMSVSVSVVGIDIHNNNTDNVNGNSKWHQRRQFNTLCVNDNSNNVSASMMCTLTHQPTAGTGTLSNRHKYTRNCMHMFSTRRSKVFVSRHNQSLNVTSSQITDYCVMQGLTVKDIRTTSTHVILKECPFCTKPTKGKADNMYKLYVQIGGGAYFCHRCAAKGSWFDFKQKMSGFEVQSTNLNDNNHHHNLHTNTRNQPQSHPQSLQNQQQQMQLQQQQRQTYTSKTPINRDNMLHNSASNLPMPSPKLQAAYISNLLDTTSTTSSTHALQYLTEVRGFTKQTLRKFGVGLGSYQFPSMDNNNNKFIPADCITFPWIMKASEVDEQEKLRGGAYKTHHDKQDPFVTRRIKARSLSNKGNQRLDPPGGGWGLFGWHTVPDDAKDIIITEGEYDAMAVYQATGRHAVSLPNGCRSLPVEVLPMLERFDKVYLWMDNDAPGREGAEIFAKKIGIKRCLLVQPNAADCHGKSIPKDANEALVLGHDLNTFINNATVVAHDRVMTFSDLRDQVLHEIMYPDKYVGNPVPSLPKLNEIIKGFRRGEMTVLTGPTGTGKTTFLGQLSLDFAENDVRTLWGSFEIKNTRLMHKLLQQFARGPLLSDKNATIEQKVEAIEVIADKFQDLPLYFMKFHGGSDVDDVIDAMEYSVYVHDVQHIILDNMQFMLSRNSRGFSNFDKFDMQDIALEKFRSFATEHNVHVTLVVHPRKENEGDKLGMSSFYGSAKSTQEADNVFILQSDGNRKFIEVKKNRFDGTTGYCPLHFNFLSNRYSDNSDAAFVPPSTTNGSNGSTGAINSSSSASSTGSNHAIKMISTRSASSTSMNVNKKFVPAAGSSAGMTQQHKRNQAQSSWADSILEK